MSDIALGGPLAVDLFGIGNGWIVQSSSDEDRFDRAVGAGPNGDAVASELFNGSNQVSVVLKCFDAASATELHIPVVGGVQGGFMVQTVQIVWTPQDWPTMTVTGHNHDANVHVDSEVAAYRSTFAAVAPYIMKGRGIPDVFGLAATTSDYAGLTYVLTCDHEDVPDKDGAHLAGENTNGRETVTAEFWGTPTFTVESPYSLFDEVSDSDTTSNASGAFNSASLQWERSLARLT